MELLTQNSKLKKTSEHFNVKVYNFGIPAFQDPETGKRTCPFAGSCAKICYARKGAYAWSNVKPAFVARYKATKQANFVQLITDELRKKKVQYLRVHDSGDYYSPEYIQKWLEIARLNPQVKFYSYTKSIPLFEGIELPNNYDIIFSEGSKVDHLIDVTKHRHSRIFSTKEALQKAKYVDTSAYDLLATKWFNESNKIGLILH